MCTKYFQRGADRRHLRGQEPGVHLPAHGGVPLPLRGAPGGRRQGDRAGGVRMVTALHRG